MRFVCHREARLSGPWRSTYTSVFMPDTRFIRHPLSALCLLFSVFGPLSSVLHAHPVHTSAARADYNVETRRLEVSVALDADDATHALSLRANRRVVLEREPAEELPKLLQAWLCERFLAFDAAGQPLTHLWAGHELKEESPHFTLWLHFEIPAPAGPDGLRLAHLLLTDEFPRQENTLRVRASGRECILSFRRDDAPKPVSLR